jgi:hypothetical protein
MGPSWRYKLQIKAKGVEKTSAPTISWGDVEPFGWLAASSWGDVERIYGTLKGCHIMFFDSHG